MILNSSELILLRAALACANTPSLVWKCCSETQRRGETPAPELNQFSAQHLTDRLDREYAEVIDEEQRGCFEDGVTREQAAKIVDGVDAIEDMVDNFEHTHHPDNQSPAWRALYAVRAALSEGDFDALETLIIEAKQND